MKIMQINQGKYLRKFVYPNKKKQTAVNPSFCIIQPRFVWPPHIHLLYIHDRDEIRPRVRVLQPQFLVLLLTEHHTVAVLIQESPKLSQATFFRGGDASRIPYVRRTYAHKIYNIANIRSLYYTGRF